LSTIWKWFLPSRGVIDHFRRANLLFHLTITICGLTVIIGSVLVDIFQIDHPILDTIGVILFYVFAFTLLANIPYTVAALIFFLKDRPLVFRGITFLTFIATLAFFEESPITDIVFIGYAGVVLCTSWKPNLRIIKKILPTLGKNRQ